MILVIGAYFEVEFKKDEFPFCELFVVELFELFDVFIWIWLDVLYVVTVGVEFDGYKLFD